MKMMIDEIIKKEYEIAAEFQKAVDTHIVGNSGVTMEEIYCDDTEVIEEHLQRCKDMVDYHKQIADIMSKYQRIEKIVENRGGKPSLAILDRMVKVVEDGK